MSCSTEEMFIHFACYRGEASRKGLMFAAAVSDEEPVVIDMHKELIPEHIYTRLHDHEVRKYYFLPYDIFSEMLNICNIRRHQGHGTWINIGRRLAWLGICSEQEADENRLADLFPVTGRMIKKYENAFKTFCYPDKYFGKMCNPDAHVDEWQNMKRYMTAVVKLEQEFINWCRIQKLGFPYEKIRCHRIRNDVVDSILEDAWLQEGRLHSKKYWDKRYLDMKAETGLDKSCTDVERIAAIGKLRNEYAFSYSANVEATRYLSTDARTVWNGNRGRIPEFIRRYIHENNNTGYCLIEFCDLEKRVLMQQAGISAYAADRVCNYRLGTDEIGKLYAYMHKFAETLSRTIDNHSSEEIGEYLLSWFGHVLMIRQETGRTLLINNPQKLEDNIYSIKDRDGFVISVPRLMNRLAYQKAEMLCIKKAKELTEFGIGIVNVRGCKILAGMHSMNDEVYEEIGMKLRIDKYGVNPRFTFERSAYGNAQ